MSNKLITVRRPGIRGEITDRPSWALSAEEAVRIEDAHTIPGVLAQRRGWEYDGSVADVASNLQGVYRAKFGLSNAVRTITTASGAFYVHKASASGTAFSVNGGPYLPRAFYNNSLVMVDSNGTAPVILYSGSDGATSTAVLDPTFTAGESTIRGTTISAAPAAGMYVLNSKWFDYANRVITASRVMAGGTTTAFALEHVTAANTMVLYNDFMDGQHLQHFALTFPAMLVREEATVTVGASGAVTGYGTNFQTTDATAFGGLGEYQRLPILILVPTAGTPIAAGVIYSRASATSLTAMLATQAAKTKAYVASNVASRDACAHRGSIIFGGLPDFPSRVLLSPPGWDMLSPPGGVVPWDPTATISSATELRYLLLDFIDVPAGDDSDPIVALLSSPGPLLVLKRGSVHAINGSFPSFSQNLLRDDIGCIDVRSAISLDEGQFWAGETGIFRYLNGRIEDLTDDRINAEWRRIVREGVTYCAMGVAHGHLVVSVKAATTSRTYVLNLSTGAWSRMTNVLARYLHTARISGEVEALFATDDARQGRVLDLSPCFTGTKVTARDAQTKAAADATDDAGTGPAIKYWSPTTLHSDGEPGGESRLLEVTTVLNAVDSAAASTVTVGTVHSGRVDASTEEAVSVATVTSDATDLVDRRRHRVGVSGRLHQVKVEAGTVASTLSELELHEIGMRVRERRGIR